MSEPEDRELVAAIVSRRDPAAFDQLYDRYSPALYGFALRLSGGDEPEAQALVHDTWIRAVEKLAGFAWRSALRSWLCAILINCARELAREAGRDAGPPIENLPILREDPVLAGTLARIDLERALASLAPGYRHALVLHDIEGYTHEEIGGMLGISEGTSKSQVARARAAMRRALGAREGG